MSDIPNQQKIETLLQQLAREISFTSAGSDAGLLPIREILSNLSELLRLQPGQPSALEQALAGRLLVDKVMDSLRPFNADDLAALTQIVGELLKNSPTVSQPTIAAPNAEALAKIGKNLDHLAMELVLAEVGTDQEQVPIRDILFTIAQVAGDAPQLAKISYLAQAGVKKMDEVMEALRTFKSDDMSFLVLTLENLNRTRRDILSGNIPTISDSELPQAIPMTKDSLPERTPAPESRDEEVSTEEPFIDLATVEDRDLLGEFINEAYEHLEYIEQGVLQLEENPTSSDTLNSVFRSYHTLKGGSGFLNLTPINRLAHQLENLLDLARQQKLDVTSEIISLILEGGDIIKKFVAGIQMQVAGKAPIEILSFPTLGLISRVKAIAEGRPTPVPPPAVPVQAVASVAIAASGPAPVQTPVPSIPMEDAHPLHTPAAQHSQAAATANGTAKINSVVKVDTLKLDSLFDLVGEMVIAHSLIAQDPELQEIRSQRLIRNLSQLSRITNDLQKTAMSIRMVPIRATFQKMQRVVRDICAKVNKHVELHFSGEDTELDRTIIEEISDPLIHMVRNSIDHGIESEEVRLQRGKNPVGVITLNAFHQGGSIVIQISDDGNGLNKEKILAKALEKGIVTKDQQLSEKEIYGLIFAPGFSTADQITEISGRGVGMDVVTRNIEKLRGKIDTQSTPGKGSTFSIYLPLTLAIIEGLIIRVGDQRYILPTLSIRESFRPTADIFATVQKRGEMLQVRNTLLPLLRLSKVFHIENAENDPMKAIAIVVESGDSQRAILVDELVGKQEVVIKSLAEQFQSNKYLAGAAILGDGTVGLILDPAILVNGQQVAFDQIQRNS